MDEYCISKWNSNKLHTNNFHRRQTRNLSLIPLNLLIGGFLLCNDINISRVQAQSPLSPTTDAANLSAEEQFKRGNVTRAIQLWSRDIKNGTETVKSLYNRSQAYIVLRQYESALQDLNQLISIQGVKTPVQVYIVRGIALNELNRLAEAIEDFNQAEKLEPSIFVYTNRGLAYQRLGQLSKAIADLSQSVKLSPTPIAKLNLANVRVQIGQFTEVVDEMRLSLIHI